jgi:hypothetical protein
MVERSALKVRAVIALRLEPPASGSADCFAKVRPLYMDAWPALQSSATPLDLHRTPFPSPSRGGEV